MSISQKITGRLPCAIAGLSFAAGAHQMACADGFHYNHDNNNAANPDNKITLQTMDVQQPTTSPGFFAEIDAASRFKMTHESMGGESFYFTSPSDLYVSFALNDRFSLDFEANTSEVYYDNNHNFGDSNQPKRATATYTLNTANNDCTTSISGGLLGQFRTPPTSDWHGEGIHPVWDKGMRFEQIDDFAGLRLNACYPWTGNMQTQLTITAGRTIGDSPDRSLEPTIDFLDKSDVAWGANISTGVEKRFEQPSYKPANKGHFFLDKLTDLKIPQIDIEDVHTDIYSRIFGLVNPNAPEKSLQERLDKTYQEIRLAANTLDSQDKSQLFESFDKITGKNIENGINDIIDFLQTYPGEHGDQIKAIIDRLPDGDVKQKLIDLDEKIRKVSQDTKRQLNKKEQLGVVALALGTDSDNIEQLDMKSAAALMTMLSADRGRSDALSRGMALKTEWDGEKASFSFGVNGGIIQPGTSAKTFKPGPSSQHKEIFIGTHMKADFYITTSLEYDTILSANYYNNYLGFKGIQAGNYSWGNSLTYHFGKADRLSYLDGQNIHADLAYTGDLFFGESRYQGVGANYKFETGDPGLQFGVHGSVGRIETGQNIFVDEPGLFSRVTGKQSFTTWQTGINAHYHF